MNTVTVTIAGVDHPMRWEVKPIHEFETLHPAFNGAQVSWQTSAFQSAPLLALWHMCLKCRDGNPKITESEAEALLQAYLDEGHTIDDARELVGEAGVAGHFLKVLPIEAVKPETAQTEQETPAH
jgi:hypothetical protein